MRHFIWVLTVCKSTSLGVTSLHSVKTKSYLEILILCLLYTCDGALYYAAGSGLCFFFLFFPFLTGLTEYKFLDVSYCDWSMSVMCYVPGVTRKVFRKPNF